MIGRRQIELYSRLIHTVDHVEGRLQPDSDALDAFLSHAWAVTVTGAPKQAAIQFLEDHEKSPRGWYGGAIGALHFNGNLNTGLTLRTMQIVDGIAHVRAGGTLAALDYPMHGKQSALAQQEGWLFEGLPAGIRVGRYHSLVAATVPDCLRVTARTADGQVMAIEHRQMPIFAVQFHPESILTLQGYAGRFLLANVLQTLAGQASTWGDAAQVVIPA